MATDDIGADHAAFRAGGVECSDLIEGGRARPDGYQVKWINNKVEGDWQGLIPFIIEDVTPRAERLPRETAHENGVTGIESLSFATERCGALCRWRHVGGDGHWRASRSGTTTWQQLACA